MNGTKTLQRELIKMKESGQPIPNIRLVGGEIFHDLVVHDVGINFIELRKIDTEHAMYLPICHLLTIGTF